MYGPVTLTYINHRLFADMMNAKQTVSTADMTVNQNAEYMRLSAEGKKGWTYAYETYTQAEDKHAAKKYLNTMSDAIDFTDFDRGIIAYLRCPNG